MKTEWQCCCKTGLVLGLDLGIDPLQVFLLYLIKGRYTFGYYSKQNINLKTDLVTSIGELLIVKHCRKRLPLK